MTIFRKFMLVLAVVALGAAVFPAASVISAAPMPTIEAFHASCRAFSVAFTMQGLTNDQDGWDRLRFAVTDGSGKVLFTEDSVRMVGATTSASVFNLSYQNGTPAKNPIRFSILDLDMFLNPTGTVLAETSVDSACLAPMSRAAYYAGLLPQGVKGTLKAESVLYATPNGAPLPLTLPAGRELTGIYRTIDNAWIGVYVGGENLVWLRAEDMDVDIWGMLIEPQELDRSQQVSAVPVVGAPVTTALARYAVNFRNAPNIRGTRIGRIPFNVTVAVYGRSADSGWLAVSYNGVRGWTAARYFRLDGGILLTQLPVLR